MINWIALEDIEELNAIRQSSSETPCVIFKHSTRCSISSIAKSRLEKSKDWDNHSVKVYYLDLIERRDISNKIAEVFQVEHASPQLLLIEHGDCTWNTSHLDISPEKLQARLS
ncbi:MAG: bacillithiol system redox-active protein YtxJ [Saprospiraceae bacterium]|nr:bacillithiol system redox-active protein YtxJ [Saprospiraceae bacterium]